VSNYTTDLYETKREIVNFSKTISKGLGKIDSKFVMDMIYGIFKSGSTLTSQIARSLEEKVKLNSTIMRICNNLYNLDDNSVNIIKKNYQEIIKKKITKEEVVCELDDTDIAKEYGKKFEDLCIVRDASSIIEKLVSGYHGCEAVIISEEIKQPISIYSKIYSTESYTFKSKNNYTLESMEYLREMFPNKKRLFTADRAYDAQYFYKSCFENNDSFIVRLKDVRTLLFKDKKRNVLEVAKSRKGKIKMKMQFSEGSKDCYISYTRVRLPKYTGYELTMIAVYGLSEEEPMILLTNKEVKEKDDAIEFARHYMNRWRIEEYFRAKKQEFDFENMRVRNLKSMNNLNMFLSIVLGEISLLAESMDKKLLCYKITERSKSLRRKVIVWISQIARGIVEILKYAKTGIKEFQGIEKRIREKQLSLF
jgi:hypothetical protein